MIIGVFSPTAEVMGSLLRWAPGWFGAAFTDSGALGDTTWACVLWYRETKTKRKKHIWGVPPLKRRHLQFMAECWC